jgi:uncharacterized protein YqgC (DUF456 family)
MDVLEVLAIVLVVAGVLGAFLPILPGSPLIFAGALLYDYSSDWTTFGWLWLGVLLLLMVGAEVAEWWLSNMGAKVGGASWQALVVGAIGGLIGLFIPPFGFFIGAVGGVIATEYWRTRSLRGATKAGGGWFVGWLLGLIVQVLTVATMTFIFVWQLWV